MQLRRLGGVSDSKTLIAAVGVREFRLALREGHIVKAGPNRYVLPGGKERLEAAARVAGSLSHVSAAQHHGWKVKRPPEKIQVVVPRGRRLSTERREGLEIFHGPIDGIVTDKVRTVIDCARLLPFDEALGIADSALRDPAVTMEALLEAARASPRTGRSRVLRVLKYADPGAANTFETSLRALCIEAGFNVETQVKIGHAFCDVADRTRRVAIEGDSYRYHSDPDGFYRDVRRHTGFARRGWLVLRFTVEDVLESPDYVLAVLHDVLIQRSGVTADAG